ncbi:aldolase [Alphaproteobacteria bacterium]|jgi:ribulose-5-phosphate 4-epimerase/fuculose-1-phosphate aldolase|nr:aldolase [Alphaproteobacteria bacterium]MDB9915239.1 aldolase [Alphaproteobacteria bacterium]|tara:strand:+ start:3481 stop:4128 length:648 start_codon:yes stop_codon:yes gene_type:complete
MNENKLREQICNFSSSLFKRGLTHGSTGNISARLGDDSFLVTPTGSSFGTLDPNEIVKVLKDGSLEGSHLPTKELPLHKAFYDTRQTKSGAVVHLHSTYSVALSMLPGIDKDNVLPQFTPYSIMLLGKVKLLPFFVPGDPAMGDAIKGLAGKRSAVLLANHGPVVSGKTLEASVNAIEELENTAKLALILRGMNAIELDPNQVKTVVNKFDIEWD